MIYSTTGCNISQLNFKISLNSCVEIKECLIKKENCRGKVSFFKCINSESSSAPLDFLVPSMDALLDGP